MKRLDGRCGQCNGCREVDDVRSLVLAGTGIQVTRALPGAAIQHVHRSFQQRDVDLWNETLAANPCMGTSA
jgi:hypothetical protein